MEVLRMKKELKQKTGLLTCKIDSLILSMFTNKIRTFQF